MLLGDTENLRLLSEAALLGWRCLDYLLTLGAPLREAFGLQSLLGLSCPNFCFVAQRLCLINHWKLRLEMKFLVLQHAAGMRQR